MNDGRAIEIAGTLNLANGGSVNSFAEAGQGRGMVSLSLGGYNTSPDLTLSAYIAPTTKAEGFPTSDGVPDGALLGFNKANPGDYISPIGILLDCQGGISLDVKNSIGSASCPVIPYTGGTFNPLLGYLLTYTIDTTTGAITNLSLEGSTADYSPLYTASAGYFTSSAIKNVDIGTDDRYYTTGQGGGYYGGNFADLNLTTTGAVPEPTTWALVGLGGLALIIRRRRSV